MFRRFHRAVLVLSAAAVLAGAVAAASASPALAYGKANWQVTFSGTATFPGSGVGYGFWGWCDFAGGLTSDSGTSGDCEESQYFHAPAGGGFTCQLSVDLTAWNVGINGDFFVTGTATVHPTRLTASCLGFFPGSASFTDFDYGIPAAPGHYNLGGIGGAVGEFQVTVTQIK